ncbi:MAG: hypothetical protein JXA90_11775 [Planctomycetes bacterium]|nr:hypothetical protein [Planctomycetota bacterium]
MLDLVEKIIHGFCLVVVLLVATLYIWFGVTSTTPEELVQPVRSTLIPEPARAAEAAMPEKQRELAQKIDEAQIRQKLQTQGVRTASGPIEKRHNTIPPSTFEIIQSEPNWSKQLNMVGSMLLTGAGNQKTRLKITKIHEHALLRKLGFETGDVIELLDGEITEFNEHSTLRYRSMFKDAVDRLRRGESTSVTITRNGQPVHLVFSL